MQQSGEPVRTTIDGVPVYSLDVPGQMRAVLTFRVGVADETLPMRGVTHLVEHLAMRPLLQGIGTRDRVNARVEPLRTRFLVTGEPSEISTFLAEVTRY